MPSHWLLWGEKGLSCSLQHGPLQTFLLSDAGPAALPAPSPFSVRRSGPKWGRAARGQAHAAPHVAVSPTQGGSPLAGAARTQWGKSMTITKQCLPCGRRMACVSFFPV